MTDLAALPDKEGTNWFQRLRYPARGYFTIWCIAQAASVGILLGWIVVEPKMWWRNLLSVAAIVLLTVALYHTYLFTDRGFNWIDQRLSALSNTENGKSGANAGEE